MFFTLVIVFLNSTFVFAMDPTKLNPTDNGSIANLDDNISIEFFYEPGPPFEISQNWDNGSYGGINLFKKPQGAPEELVEHFNVNSPGISGHDTHVVIINPTELLETNTCYIVTVGGCAVVDEVSMGIDSDCPGGRDFLEIGGYQWNFTTAGGVCDFDLGCIVMEDAQILHLSPPDNGAHFQKNQSLNITFNKNVTKKSGNFVLKKFSDNSVLETIPVNSSQVTGWGTSRIIINPSTNFTDNTQYFMNMDFDGYRTESDKNEWNFTIQKYPSVFSGSGL